jgi:hypothetical protein
MKKLMLSVAVVFTLATSTAHAFIPQMSYFVNREVAVTRVWNNTYRNITCFGQAYGRTWQGVVLNSYVNGLVIFPGQSVDVYVHSNFYDPMVQAWAQINCNVW